MNRILRFISVILLLLAGAGNLSFSLRIADNSFQEKNNSQEKEIVVLSDLSEDGFDLSDYNNSTAPDFQIRELPDFLSPDFTCQSHYETATSLKAVKLSQEIDLAFDSSDIVFPFHTFL